MTALQAHMPPPVQPTPRHRLRAMQVADLDRVLAIEVLAYSHPWTRGNFVDSLAAGYLAELLVDGDDSVIGYFIAMPGVGELHLLNLTVAPAHQRAGHARTLLDALQACCQRRGLPVLWLEVRAGNARARHVYLRRGFVEVGLRRRYYPAGHLLREDAIVMRFDVPALPSDGCAS
ncbi:ribosomal protein S18-alanine N-acetyltransferase [Pseudorhodoferax sp.]|uniref:ribosomal protein S18-alanine N-acetyltransferase n=1 Tax=Pseudorhodoferax sp. TaxID=1993553 RepID=UPI002DD619D2|nr:ribosomal protein S18-alanine N-acetyltransferase [Pseudorhodoferax sp.]